MKQQFYTFFFLHFFFLSLSAQEFQSIEVGIGPSYNFLNQNLNPPLIGGHLFLTSSFKINTFEVSGGFLYELRGDRSLNTSFFEGTDRLYHHLGLHTAVQIPIFKKDLLGLIFEPTYLVKRVSRFRWKVSESEFDFSNRFDLSIGTFFEKRFSNSPLGIRFAYRMPIVTLKERLINSEEVYYGIWKHNSIRLSLMYRIFAQP